MRAFLIAFSVAIAAGVALLLPVPLSAFGPGQLRAILISVHIGAMCWASGALGHEVRVRFPRHPLRVTVLQVVVGALLCLSVVASWTMGVATREGGVPLTFPIAVAGGALFCTGMFALLSVAITALTRGATSIRVRAAAFGFVCATTVVLFHLGVQLTMPASGWFWVALPIAIAAFFSFGLSSAFSYSLAEPIDRTIAALRDVSQGNLEARLDESSHDELGELARTFNEMTRGLEDRVFLERAFGQYVAPSVLEELKRRQSLAIAAERREASVLFADVRGFTAFSETTTPEDVLRVLNVYFERVVEFVASHGGYLNKFIGDAVMVVFNAPTEHVDHAARAVRCARDIQAEVTKLNASGAFGPGREVKVGIGVNSGPLVAGTLGSARRAEYTVIGDTVNTASRLCSSAKPGEILVGAATAAALAGGAIALEALGPLSVKGKAQPLDVFRAV